MKGILADTGFIFEAEGYTISTMTVFSAIHGKFTTQVLALQSGKVKHKSTKLFHVELIPDEYDLREAVKEVFTTILKHKQ
jgi:hypothetical protein